MSVFKSFAFIIVPRVFKIGVKKARFMKGYASAPAEVEVNLSPFRSASRSGLKSTSPA